eukprot:1133696-Amphidinium_carterae.2
MSHEVHDGNGCSDCPKGQAPQLQSSGILGSAVGPVMTRSRLNEARRHSTASVIEGDSKSMDVVRAAVNLRDSISQADKRSRMAIISSEPLTSVKDEWLPIPRDSCVLEALDLGLAVVRTMHWHACLHPVRSEQYRAGLQDTFVVCTRAFDLEGSGNARKAMVRKQV